MRGVITWIAVYYFKTPAEWWKHPDLASPEHSIDEPRELPQGHVIPVSLDI